MSHVGRAAWKRFAALGLAGALAVAGLWLAVGAGASGGTSARTAAYPEPPYYDIKLDKTPPKVQYAKRQVSNVKAKFKFHIKADRGYESGVKYLNTKCKLDGKRYKKCASPKTYKRLKRGKHKFKVKAVYDGCNTGPNCDASNPTKYGWKIK